VYWLTNLRVRTKMLIAAAVPLLTFAVCSAAIVYVALQIHFENLARSRLEVAATFLTHAGRLGLISRSATSLRQPVHTVLADPDIVYVAVYSADGELLYAHGSLDTPPPPTVLRINGSDVRYSSSGMGLRELVRVVRYPRDQDTPELLGFIPELDTEGTRAGEPEGILRIMMSTQRQDAGYRQMLSYSGLFVIIILILGAMVTLAISRVLVRAIETRLEPRGAAAVVEAEHLCMTARGIKSRGSRVVTVAWSGLFDSDAERRKELLGLLDLTPTDESD